MSITHFSGPVYAGGGPVSSPGEFAMYPNTYVVGGTNASDGNQGNDKSPFATVQKACDTVTDGDLILVRQGSYSEAITTPVYGGAKNVTLAGTQQTMSDACTLIAPTASDIVLDMRAPGWRVSGFRIVGGASAASVRLNMDAASPSAGESWSPYTQFDNNMFLAGDFGIDWVGAPYSCYIYNNTFEFQGTAAMTSSGTPIAIPYRCIIAGNFFHSNTHHMHMTYYASRGFNSSLIRNNYFGAATATFVLTLTGGRNNIVVGNTFPGDYSTAKYLAGTTDEWAGNYSMDTTETEVGTDGSTISTPAA